MRIVLAVPCLLFHWTIGFSQAISIETEQASVRYYRLPDEPLDSSWRTYSSVAKVSSDSYQTGDQNEKTLVQQMIGLDGYTRTAMNGDIQIETVIGTLTISGEKLKSRKTTTIDKENKEHVLHEFYYEIKYVVPLSYSIKSKDGIPIVEKTIFSSTDALTFTTGYFKNDSELDAWWRNSKTLKLSELKQARIKSGLLIIGEAINLAYGFVPKEEMIRFEMIGKKKHPDYESYHQALQVVILSFGLMEANRQLDDVKKSIEPALTFYRESSMKYDATNKDELKLKHICLYNLALASYWLEDFDHAQIYASELLQIDQNDKSVIKLVDNIKSTHASMKKAGRSSRHWES